VDVETAQRQPTNDEIAELLVEIERYLAAVDAFRREGCEPTWATDRSFPEWWLAEHLPRQRRRRKLMRT
jgi:hypothetical protein